MTLSKSPRTISAAKPLVKKVAVGPDGMVKPHLDGKMGYQPVPTSEAEASDGETVPVLTCGERLLEDTKFQSCMVLLILANALVIGLETDIRDYQHWDDIEDLFLLAFTCELVLKLCVLGPRTFFSTYHADFQWNVFDMFIVGLGLFDFFMTHLGGGSSGGFATLFRIIRLLRILRMFRIIKFLKQLYMLAFGLVEACKALFWVAILMAFVLYICSIVLVKTVGRPPVSDHHHDFLDLHFGNIIDSMLTLFVLMSSPNLPIYLEQPGLVAHKPFLVVFLIAFITFGSFGIIAMLTGVISESMFEKNEMRKEEQRSEHEAMRCALGDNSRELFLSLSLDGGGEASVQDCKTLAPRMVHMMESAGATVTYADISRMIDNMDTDGSARIGVDEFVSTIDAIAEGLSPLGIQEVHHEVGAINKKLEEFQQAFDFFSKRLEAKMATEMQEVQRLVKDVERTPSRPQPEAVPEVTAARPTQLQGTYDAQPKALGLDAESMLARMAEMLSRHSSAMHQEMDRQCKELAATQERTMWSLHYAGKEAAAKGKSPTRASGPLTMLPGSSPARASGPLTMLPPGGGAMNTQIPGIVSPSNRVARPDSVDSISRPGRLPSMDSVSRVGRLDSVDSITTVLPSGAGFSHTLISTPLPVESACVDPISHLPMDAPSAMDFVRKPVLPPGGLAAHVPAPGMDFVSTLLAGGGAVPPARHSVSTLLPNVNVESTLPPSLGVAAPTLPPGLPPFTAYIGTLPPGSSNASHSQGPSLERVDTGTSFGTSINSRAMAANVEAGAMLATASVDTKEWLLQLLSADPERRHTGA